MPRQVSHIALRGGLDIVSSPLFVKPGRIWATVNYEAVEAGYRRTDGYERVDGRSSPSEAEYYILPYDPSDSPDAGQATNLGNVVLPQAVHTPNMSATATLLAIVGDDGTETDIAGYFVLSEIVGTIADDTQIQFGSSNLGLGYSNGTPGRRGADLIDLDLVYLDLAAANRRTPITEVPGTGPVRGVWSYKGVLYAVRDDDANTPPTSAVMYKATAMGWEALPLFVLPAGGRYEFRNENFGGQSATQRMFGVNGVGPAFQWDGTAFTSISTGHSDDRPTHLAIHFNHLLLAYRGGSLIVSATGDPVNYDAISGAAEIGTGQEINGFVHVGAGNTLVVGQDRMQVLVGFDKESFQLPDQSDTQTGRGGMDGPIGGGSALSRQPRGAALRRDRQVRQLRDQHDDLRYPAVPRQAARGAQRGGRLHARPVKGPISRMVHERDLRLHLPRPGHAGDFISRLWAGRKRQRDLPSVFGLGRRRGSDRAGLLRGGQRLCL